MKQHQWIGHGTAGMSQAQAQEWLGLPGGGVADAPMQLTIASVVCVFCDVSTEDINDVLWSAR